MPKALEKAHLWILSTKSAKSWSDIHQGIGETNHIKRKGGNDVEPIGTHKRNKDGWKKGYQKRS